VAPLLLGFGKPHASIDPELPSRFFAFDGEVSTRTCYGTLTVSHFQASHQEWAP